MASVSHRSRSVQSVLDRIVRLVALLAWVGQLAVLAAPFVEASSGTPERAHVESHHNPLHHQHDPDLCVGCVALGLVGIPEVGRPPVPDGEIAHDQPTTGSLARGVDAEAIGTRPRAPPVWDLLIRFVPRFELDSHTTTIHAIRTLAVRAPAGRDGHGAGAAAWHAA